jgi:hypothetical protein
VIATSMASQSVPLASSYSALLLLIVGVVYLNQGLMRVNSTRFKALIISWDLLLLLLFALQMPFYLFQLSFYNSNFYVPWDNPRAPAASVLRWFREGYLVIQWAAVMVTFALGYWTFTKRLRFKTK